MTIVERSLISHGLQSRIFAYNVRLRRENRRETITMRYVRRNQGGTRITDIARMKRVKPF